MSEDEPSSREQQGGESLTNEAPAGPVRLELGMDAEALDKILDEIEVRKLSCANEKCFRFLFVVLSLHSPSAS